MSHYEDRLKERYTILLKSAENLGSSDRVRVLRETGLLYSALNHEAKHREGSKLPIRMMQRKIISTIPHRIQYTPADVRSLANTISEEELTLDLPFTRQYFENAIRTFKAEVGEGMNYATQGDRVDELRSQVMEWGEEGIKKKDLRRATKWQKELENLRLHLETEYLFGPLDDLRWQFELQSDEEAQEDIQRRIDLYAREFEDDLSYLVDRTHPQHPPWFLYLKGDSDIAPLFVPVGMRQMPWKFETNVGSAWVKQPRVQCIDIEARYESIPEYRKACRKLLTEFLRSEEFLRRTGYRQAILTGFQNPVPVRELRELQWQQFSLEANQQPITEAYGVHLTHPQTRMVINDGNRTGIPISLPNESSLPQLVRI